MANSKRFLDKHEWAWFVLDPLITLTLLLIALMIFLNIYIVTKPQEVDYSTAQSIDYQPIQEMNENIGEIRNSIDNDYIKCEVCGAHVHDWWYIHYGDTELEVCQFCYQDIK